MSRSRLAGTVLPVAAVTEEMEDVLYTLFERHYDGVSRGTFRRDLYEKDWVILLRESSSSEIKGFSTLMRVDIVAEGVPIVAAFSGDTIVDRGYWGQQQLVETWYGLMEKLRREHFPAKLYWFLISKGYRTYLYLPTFFKEFYPRFDKETPPFEQRLIDILGSSRYPENFDPETGVIEFSESEGHLKEELTGIPPHRLKDPNVRFFLERNPGYGRGSELVCVAEFSPRNLKPFTLRLGAETVAKEAE